MVSDRRVETADIGVIKHYVTDLKSLLVNGELSERKGFIRSFIQEIIVSREEVRLVYTVPLVPDHSTINAEEVLPSVKYGGRFRTVGRTFETAFSLHGS